MPLLENTIRRLTGIRPTGRMHIGHYFAVIKPALELHSTVLIAQYHAPQSGWQLGPALPRTLAVRASKIAAAAEKAVARYRRVQAKNFKKAGTTTDWEPIEDMGAYMQLRDGELIACPMKLDGSREEDPNMETNVDPDIHHDEREVNMNELNIEQLRAIKQALNTETSEDGNEIHEL